MVHFSVKPCLDFHELITPYSCSHQKTLIVKIDKWMLIFYIILSFVNSTSFINQEALKGHQGHLNAVSSKLSMGPTVSTTEKVW